jgi:hypothetical protein
VAAGVSEHGRGNENTYDKEPWGRGRARSTARPTRTTSTRSVPWRLPVATLAGLRR